MIASLTILLSQIYFWAVWQETLTEEAMVTLNQKIPYSVCFKWIQLKEAVERHLVCETLVDKFPKSAVS